MSRPRRAGRSLRMPEARVVRVHTEGRVTERDYLNHWARRSRGVLISWGASGMSPLSLVARAREEVNRSRRFGSRQGSLSFDEIWCVFDVDEHPNRSQAIFEARQSDINVAVSNPCFELWLVLHVEGRARPVHRSDIQRDATKLNLIRARTSRMPRGAGGLKTAMRTPSVALRASTGCTTATSLHNAPTRAPVFGAW